MAESFNSDIEVGPPPVTLPKRRSTGAIALLVLLLIAIAAASFAWLNRQSLMELTRSVGDDAATPVVASTSENAVAAADFAAFQQQTSASIQSATGLLTAQQAELKRLSDQMQALTGQVAGLATRLEQTSGRPVAAQPTPTAAVQGAAPSPARPAPAAPRKRPAERPAGAISIGGAPLPGATAR